MIRLLESKDYDKYYNLINKFRQTKFTYDDFLNFIESNHINVWIIEINDCLVGTGTILFEQKLIHNFGVVAHIEDVVISENHKKKGYGLLLIQHLIQKSKEKSCYKIILNCDEKIKFFYEKNNFKTTGIQMSYYL